MGINCSSAFAVTLNFAPQKRKVRTGPNLCEEKIPNSLPVVLSKRMMLPQINRIAKPLGFSYSVYFAIQIVDATFVDMRREKIRVR